MKLIVEDYLQRLNERPELEVLVVSLLEKMGLNVYSTPQKGVRQYGVDVAAAGMWPGDTVEAVHLLTIKAGDITRKNWDSGGQDDLRQSLNEIEDLYLAQRIRPQDGKKPIMVHICCGGRVRQDVDANVTAYMAKFEEKHKGEHLHISVLNGSVLTLLLLKYFFDERTFVSEEQRLLKRCFAILEEPDLMERYYNDLLYSVLKENSDTDESLPMSRRMDCACRLLLCLGILVQHALEIKHLEGVYRAIERSVVYLLHYLGVDSAQEKPSKHVLRQIWASAALYDRIAFAFFENVEKLSDAPYLFTLAVGGNEVDVNLCFYNTLSRLAEYGSFLLQYYSILEETGFLEENLKEEIIRKVSRIANGICGLINCNPVSRQPLKDYQHYAILLTLVFLKGVGRIESAHTWTISMMQQITCMFNINKGYPTISLSYEELLDFVEKPLSAEKQKLALRSSELYPSLALFSLHNKWDDVYEAVKQTICTYAPNMNLQLWFMDEKEIGALYELRGVNGHQLCNIDINDKEQFSTVYRLECEHSQISGNYALSVLPSFFFVACRLNGVPIPASFWLGDDESEACKKTNEELSHATP